MTFIRYLLLGALFLLGPRTGYADEPQRLFLITGCARSGTTFMARVLNRCGLDVGHEGVGGTGTVSWTMAVESSCTPFGPPYKKGNFKHIFHQVRHPLDTISSVYANEPQESWEFIYRHLPQISPEDSKLEKCVKYWIYWNQQAEAKAEMTYQVENLKKALKKIGKRLGVELPRTLARKISKTVNHREDYHYFSWKEIKQKIPKNLYDELKRQAIRYGY